MPCLDLFFADICIPYLLSEKYPASGQREVYKAINTVSNKGYVIKIANYTPFTIGRLQRELSVLQEIESKYFPKIVWQTPVTRDMLHDYFDQNYYQARLDDGQSIRDEVEEFRKRPFSPFLISIEEYIKNIPWEEFQLRVTGRHICALLAHCVSALKLLWDKKIVHRDLKPANILIRPDMTPVIIDLGIAKSLNDGTSDLTLSFHKNPHTVLFASPEQLMDDKKAINYKTDQYSLGIVAYNLLTCRFPFGNVHEIGPDELLQNMINNRYIPISSTGVECSDALESVIRKLLMPNPYQRYRDADTILDRIGEIERSLP